MGRKTETHRQWETIEMKRAKDITHACNYCAMSTQYILTYTENELWRAYIIYRNISRTDRVQTSIFLEDV